MKLGTLMDHNEARRGFRFDPTIGIVPLDVPVEDEAVEDSSPPNLAPVPGDPEEEYETQ